jgi:hypothetical protein
MFGVETGKADGGSSFSSPLTPKNPKKTLKKT